MRRNGNRKASLADGSVNLLGTNLPVELGAAVALMLQLAVSYL